jgi:hypothetical protein
MKEKWILLIAAVFGIEFTGVKRRVEVAGVGVGVAIHRGPRSVKALLNFVDHDQRVLKGRAAGFGEGSGHDLVAGLDLVDRW